MKRVSLLVNVLVLSMTGLSVANAESLRIATEGAYPPFNYVDSNNKLHGFDVDISNALCERMKVECTVVAQDWDGTIPGLIAKKYDAIIASMINTEERRKKIAFTNHYYKTPLSLAVAKGSDITSADADLRGRIIGAQSSSTQGEYAEDVFSKAGAQVKLYPTQDAANADLAAGRVDAVVSDKYPLLEWIKKSGSDCCTYLGDLKDTDAEAAIAVRKDDDKLRERLNKALDEMVADGTYEKSPVVTLTSISTNQTSLLPGQPRLEWGCLPSHVIEREPKS